MGKAEGRTDTEKSTRVAALSGGAQQEANNGMRFWLDTVEKVREDHMN